MKLKLNLTFLILGLFLFKVGVVDSLRNFGNHNNGDYRSPSSTKAKHYSIR